MITSLVAVLIAASALIPIDQVVTAHGIVVSQSPTILVQPLDTSIVRSIDVREGQRVRAGEVLRGWTLRSRPLTLPPLLQL
jgi:HlyD family secretion protein